MTDRCRNAATVSINRDEFVRLFWCRVKDEVAPLAEVSRWRSSERDECQPKDVSAEGERFLLIFAGQESEHSKAQRSISSDTTISDDAPM
jgi:hypothetical protein